MVSGWPAITDICCVYLPVEAGDVQVPAEQHVDVGPGPAWFLDGLQ